MQYLCFSLFSLQFFFLFFDFAVLHETDTTLTCCIFIVSGIYNFILIYCPEVFVYLILIVMFTNKLKNQVLDIAETEFTNKLICAGGFVNHAYHGPTDLIYLL